MSTRCGSKRVCTVKTDNSSSIDDRKDYLCYQILIIQNLKNKKQRSLDEWFKSF